MKPSDLQSPPSDLGSPTSDLRPLTSDLRRFYIAAVTITAAFAIPLYRLIKFAWHSEIHSYILLIPFISIYLSKRSEDRAEASAKADEAKRRSAVALRQGGRPRPSWLGASAAALLALGALVPSVLSTQFKHPGDIHTFTTSAYLLFLLAAAFATLGWPFIRARLFPIAFLAFFIPLPAADIDAISIGLQYASAEVSDVFLRLTGMPVLRNGLSFKFAGLSVFVAEECSGIRSTLVLFITSVLGGYLLLKRPIHRFFIAALIFPLGVLRNAFRITTISWLTVNVDPRVIDSPLHHRGGPIFFAISLIPLFLILLWFRNIERKRRISLHKEESISAKATKIRVL